MPVLPHNFPTLRQVGKRNQQIVMVNDLQAQQTRITERGRSVGGRFEHLTQVEAYVRENWSKQHPDECPTCGTNHSRQGGILNVVETLRSKTADERNQLRDEYAKLKTEIEQIQKKLGELGYPMAAATYSTSHGISHLKLLTN